MKFFAALALIASASAVSVTQLSSCPKELEISVKQLNIELDYLSRTFSKERYNNARIISDELLAQG